MSKMESFGSSDEVTRNNSWEGNVGMVMARIGNYGKHRSNESGKGIKMIMTMKSNT